MFLVLSQVHPQQYYTRPTLNAIQTCSTTLCVIHRLLSLQHKSTSTVQRKSFFVHFQCVHVECLGTEGSGARLGCAHQLLRHPPPLRARAHTNIGQERAALVPSQHAVVGRRAAAVKQVQRSKHSVARGQLELSVQRGEVRHLLSGRHGHQRDDLLVPVQPALAQLQQTAQLRLRVHGLHALACPRALRGVGVEGLRAQQGHALQLRARGCLPYCSRDLGLVLRYCGCKMCLMKTALRAGLLMETCNLLVNNESSLKTSARNHLLLTVAMCEERFLHRS
mmetsp:Transcript_7768/g.14660  ORF Transcript_7768/g.14660 Transcript_7768/m.14660 type:complete len:279 (+) Transcript_7768:208-1044(+)